MEGRLVEGDKRANFFLVAVWVETVWAGAATGSCVHVGGKGWLFFSKS